MDGVDLGNPPNQKMFDAAYRNANDLALLARRRQLQPDSRSSNTNDLGDTFRGLAEFFNAVQRPPSSASSNTSSDVPTPIFTSK